MAPNAIHPAETATRGGWKSYESVHALRGMEIFDGFVQAVTSGRWMIRYPLQIRVVFGYTVGEIFFLLPGAAVLCYIAATDFINRDLKNSGSFAALVFAVVYGLVTKNSLITFLAGIPFERSIMYHRYTSYLAIAFGLMHGLIYHLDQASGRRVLRGQDNVLSGWIAQGFAFALLLTSLWPIRRRFFNFFLLSHFICYVGVVGGLILHGAGAVMFGVALLLLDVLYRTVLASSVHNTAAKFECSSSNIVRITIKNHNMVYKGGQYAFIKVPEVSMWEWHPFSLTSAPHEKYAIFDIKVCGDWSKALYDCVQKRGGSADLSIGIDGCFGETFINIDSARYKTFLLVGGGIGITPMISIAKDLQEQGERGRPISKIKVVWTMREIDMIDGILGPNPPNGGEKGTFELDIYNSKAGQEDCEKHSLNITSGRLECSKIFSDVSQHAKSAGETRVAVLVCGPTSLISHVRTAALVSSVGGLRFDVHSEVFNF